MDSTLVGAEIALKSNRDLNLIIVGDEKVITEHLDSYIKQERVEIIHTTTNIGMNESPTSAIRTKTDSSIVMGLDLLRTREDCTAFISAGSTGAVLTGGFMKVGRIPGVSRPALSPMLPTADRRGVMVSDVGANMDCKPIHLVHFAVMADIYMRSKGIENPRIGLLNVGTEDEKGNELTLEVFSILKKLADAGSINFLGNMEARDAFTGRYDIIVTDGFAGNVLLKTLEGSGKLFSHELKRAIGGLGGLFGKLLLAKRLLKMKKSLSEDATGGAIFLGIKKPVIKAHGNSNATAICNAILVGARAGDMNLGDAIEQAIKKLPAE